MFDEDFTPWVEKVVVLSLEGGETTTAHILDFDTKRNEIVVDVLDSNRPYPGREHRAFILSTGRILAVCPGPFYVHQLRPTPPPDPCRAEYGSLDRILLFAPIILLIVPGSLILFIFLGDLPYGTQFATLIIYTAAVVLMTFSAQRGQQRYLFTCPAVESQISRLVQRHIAFLGLLSVIETAALHFRPSLPASWFIASGRNMPPFIWAQYILCMGLGLTQTLTNRSLLSRSHLEHTPAAREVGISASSGR